MSDAPAHGDDDTSDAPDESSGSTGEPAADTETAGDVSGDSATNDATAAGSDETDLDALREEVTEKYDFDNFGPSDMARMDADEWEAAFDPDTWITGTELLDRVEKDLRNRIARREVFAVLERERDRVIAYSDEGWAIVYPDGSVEGSGTVLRDVKPTIALCSMESYEVTEPPEAYELPDPEDVKSGSGELGNTMLQLVAGAQLLAGLGVLAAWLFTDAVPDAGGLANIVAPALALFFIGIGFLLFLIVANARLSDRFRAEEYRDRLRAAGITEADRPEFLPPRAVDEEAADALADGPHGERDTDAGDSIPSAGGTDHSTDDAGASGDDDRSSSERS